MLASVPELCEKLVVGQDSLAEAEEYMSCLEDSINVTFGDATIRQWRDEHDDWERRVVDVSQHASLGNPFNVPSDASAYRACIWCASLTSLGRTEHTGDCGASLSGAQRRRQRKRGGDSGCRSRGLDP